MKPIELTTDIASTLLSTFESDYQSLTHNQKVELMFHQHKRYFEMGMIDRDEDWDEFSANLIMFQNYVLTEEVSEHISQIIKLVELDRIL